MMDERTDVLKEEKKKVVYKNLDNPREYFVSMFKVFGRIFVSSHEIREVLYWLRLDLKIDRFDVAVRGLDVYEISKPIEEEELFVIWDPFFYFLKEKANKGG